MKGWYFWRFILHGVCKLPENGSGCPSSSGLSMLHMPSGKPSPVAKSFKMFAWIFKHESSRMNLQAWMVGSWARERGFWLSFLPTVGMQYWLSDGHDWLYGMFDFVHWSTNPEGCDETTSWADWVLFVFVLLAHRGVSVVLYNAQGSQVWSGD